MRRTKNWDWNDKPDKAGNYTWAQAQVSVLQDIRDELQQLNRIIGCPNFIAVPEILRGIKRNTGKKRKPRVVGKPKLRVVSRS